MMYDAEEWPYCVLGQVRVVVTGLRVRSQPDAAGEIIGSWREDQILDLWCKLGDWWLVQDNSAPDGLTGWSHQMYLVDV